MGNTESRQSPVEFTGVVLYKAIVENGAFVAWETFAENVPPSFYNINEDLSNSSTEWHLEFNGSVEYPDIVVDTKTQFAAAELKCVFQTAEGDFWALQFPNADLFAQFCQQYNGCLFENTYQTQLNEENVEKVRCMTDTNETSESNLNRLFLQELGPFVTSAQGETEESRQQWVEDMDVDEPEPPESHTKDRLVAEKGSDLRAIIMGSRERSYLVGDKGISVMSNTPHGLKDLDVELSFESLSIGGTPSSTGRRRSSFGARSTPSTTMSSCSKGILMDYETKMNLVSPGSSSIYNTDLETGKLLNEFAFKKDDTDIHVVDIVNDSKSSQMEDHSTFLSLGEKTIDRWDTRVKGGLAQSMASPITLEYEGGRSYAKNPKFSCIATTGQGYRAVGSHDGKIRLYNDKVEQIAKTSIPGLGAPIEHIDVTYDGRWVLATTKSFLIVLKTIYKEGSKELCGFTSRLGAKAPKPRLLMLKAEDIIYTKNAPFEKAKFSWITDNARKERYIVASCGRYTVQWNFRAVKVAKPDVITNGLTTVQKYTLIPKSENIVDTTFMHDTFASRGTTSPLVVLTKQRVYNVDDDDDEEDEGNEARRLRF